MLLSYDLVTSRLMVILVQNPAAKLILGKTKHSLATEALLELGWDTGSPGF